MTIRELIELLERAEDDFGNVPVELSNGVEVFALAAVFETGVKEPEVIAVCVK